MSDVLQTIRDLQFKDKRSAEALLLSFLREHTPFDVTSVNLTPSAISLNSFNGFMEVTGKGRFFFKSHTETDTIIHEYYNASLLHEAGYPIIQPIYSSTEPGRQLLIYEVIDDESVFDVAWKLENEADDPRLTSALTQAQNKADRALLEIYRATETYQSAEDAGKSPIHQLFYHRLTGGRLTRFYGDYQLGVTATYPYVQLPQGRVSLDEVRSVNWVINDCVYDVTLQDIIHQSIDLLQPNQGDWTVVGHGDAHNGNVFFRRASEDLLYFDPAFAGRHSALIDLAKPLFHNVFAMWMYYPHVIRERLTIDIQERDGRWYVYHDFTLNRQRQMFFESKIEHTLTPYLTHLQKQGKLQHDWRQRLKCALFCCPFLTMNLADNERFPPEISLLGFAMSIAMGGESRGDRSYLDNVLDAVEHNLA